MKNIFNILGFQISWWACVIGVKNGQPYIGPLFMAIFILIHFFYFKANLLEIRLIAFFALIGTSIDTAFAYSGLLSYNGLYSQNLLLAPLWITAMWCGFCATVNHSLSWLKDRAIASFLMGAVFGPLSYIAGEKFNAISFHSSMLVINITLAIVWGISIFLIFFLNKRLGL